MIVLYKDQENTVFLTLYEKTTITDYSYRLIVRSDVTQESRTIELEDLSDYQYRYNQFLIDEGSTNDLTFLVGNWNYTVEAYNNETSEVVETGIMQVKEASASVSSYQTTGTKVVYQYS